MESSRHGEDCKPEISVTSEGKFRIDSGEVAGNVVALALPKGGGERRLGLRQAFAAAGSQSEFSSQMPQLRGPVLDGGPDVLIGDGIAYAHDHVRIVNANANDCQ